MTIKTINIWQGLLAFVGISVGVFPLIRFVVEGSTGSVWHWLLDDAGGVLGWVGPLAAVALAVALIAGLERRKKHIEH